MNASIWADEKFGPFCKEFLKLLDRYSFELQQEPKGVVFVVDKETKFMAPLTPAKEKEKEVKEDGGDTK